MSSSQNNFNLGAAEKRDLVIRAAINAVPYVGGSLATLYFGAKQERRFKRLETFYQELAQEVKNLKDRIVPLEAHDREALVAIFEELNEKVESEHVQKKREFLKAYFKNTLINPVKNNYDERRFFLDTLASMTVLECDILAHLFRQTEPIKVGILHRTGVDQYATVGAIGRLKAYGFLSASQTAMGRGVDTMLSEYVKVSEFGRRFCEFCLMVS